MKVGDKVRFLSEVGGGTVSGFQGKDLVLVEDEDGFEIPMLRSQVVVIDTEDYDISKVHTGETTVPAASKKTPAAASSKGPQPSAASPAPAPKERTGVMPVERAGANQLNLYLSFLPNEVKEISTTTFETYLVNDSNYFVQVLYMSAEGANWHARFNAVIEPNSKIFVEEFDRSILNDLERLCIQTMAWKQDKVFVLKPALTTEIRLDCTKFYKLHVFQPNEFFRDPNWTVPVIRDDKPVRSVFSDAEKLQEALSGTLAPKKEDKPQPAAPEKKKKDDGPLVIDLHIEELVDTTVGMSNADMMLLQMKEFRRVMDENAKKKGQKIVFIHGKGEGVLRKSILQEVKYRYKPCTTQDASFREYGYGATLVTIK